MCGGRQEHDNEELSGKDIEKSCPKESCVQRC